MKAKIFVALLLFPSCVVFAQDNLTKWIEGSVKEAGNNTILANVNVYASKSRNSVAADKQGHFRILVTQFPDTLIFTNTGYEVTKKIIAESSDSLVVYMAPLFKEMGEVSVNTGYQMVRPNEINGSVFVIDNKTLNQQSGTNILDRLNGVVPGLTFIKGKNNSNGNPQNTTGIVINGHSTINGPLDPLIVLDNFPYEGDINNINPNDIESISVLKDAAAASIWGPRAGNGVIVITTKKGKYNQKLNIAFNTDIIVQQRPNLYSFPQLDTKDYLTIEEFLFNKGYYNGQINSRDRPALTDAVEIFIKRKSGAISSSDSLRMLNELSNTDTRKEYNRFINRPQYIQQHSLSLSGGTTNYAWTIGGNYDRIYNRNNIIHNGSEKINVHMDNVYKPFKNLQVKLGVYYTSSHENEAADAYTYNSIKLNGTKFVPYLKYANEAGNPLPVAKNIRQLYLDTAGAGALMNWNYYPAEDYKHARRTTTVEEIWANLAANYKIASFLDVDVLYQYSRQRTNTVALADTFSYYTRNLYNLLYQQATSSSPLPKGGIVDLTNATLGATSARAQLNFRKNWEKHAVTSIAGAELRQTRSDGNGNRMYGYNADPLYYSSDVDVTTLYTNFITGNSISIPTGVAALTENINRFVALYANASYIYNKKYSISGSVRKDGANIFGLKTNDKWKPLWSSGLGWNISDEPFFTVPWLSYLRLRGSYGFSGNLDLSRTALPIATYGNADGKDLPFPYAYITTLNNPELRWEKIRQINIGLDLATLDNRITGTVDIYKKRGMDLYGQTSYDYTAWGNNNVITKNVAAMKGDGVSLNLKTIIVQKKIAWITNLLFNYMSEKTSEYYTPISKTGASLLGGGNTITPVIGKPLYAISAFKWGGLNSSGDPQGYLNGNVSTDYQGIINDANKNGLESTGVVFIGSALPVTFGNIINEVSFRRFSLSFNISWKGGYYFRKNSLSYSSLFLNGEGNADFTIRWQEPGDEKRTNVPKLVYTDYPQFNNRSSFYVGSEVNILKADHLRLQYINLNYDLLIKSLKTPFNKASIYANAANLGIIWRANKDRIDPDFPNGNMLGKQITIGVRFY